MHEGEMPYEAGGATIIKEYIVFSSTSVVKIQYEHANYGILEAYIVLMF
jgi:hypothetical protein